MDPKEIKLRLDSIISQIEELKNDLETDQSLMPPNAVRLMREGRCLYCGQGFEDGEVPSRGCHSRCDQQIRRAIKEGVITDEQAVAQGLWAPKQAGGRPKKAGVFTEMANSLKISKRVELERISETDSAVDAAIEARDERRKKAAKKPVTKKKAARKTKKNSN